MSTAQATSNKATFRRFHDAMSTGDAELISKTIDEFVEPDVLIRTPVPVEATGAQALKEVFGRLYRAFPDLHITVEDVIAEGDKGRRQEHGYWDPPGRVHGPPTNRQIRHIQRDLHLPVRRRPNR